MINVSTIFPLTLLQEMLQEGYIRAVSHETLPLTLYNYTPKAQFDSVWNAATKACRGLIVEQKTNLVVARPFPKFHNHGQEQIPNELQGTVPEVYTKADGSLGIVFRYNNQTHVATRGSFTSEQAVWAKEWLDQHNLTPVEEDVPVTILVEIVYPKNRIVVDYGGLETLYYLTTVNNLTGEEHSWEDRFWFWPIDGDFVNRHEGFEDDLSSYVNYNSDMQGQEGVVAVWRLKGQPPFRLKYKSSEYVRLHAILTETSTKTVWRALKDGLQLDDILEAVPDEFAKWVANVVNELQKQFDDTKDAARTIHLTLKPYWDNRKEYALRAKKYSCRSILFAFLDGKPVDDMIWKSLEPEYERPFWKQTDE